MQHFNLIYLKNTFGYYCLLLCLTSILVACRYFYTDNSLGGNYYLWEGDGRQEYSIIYSLNGHEHDSGLNILSENVSEINFNERYIIAKTFAQNDVAHFWLIDKTKPINTKKERWNQEVVLGPLDSVGLFVLLNREKINLNFSNSKLQKRLYK